jgi:pseudouridine synthase
VSLERLQKVLAARGYASRRGAEKLIAEGRVRLNGETVHTMGLKVDPEKDRIEVDAEALQTIAKTRVVVMLYKPFGVVTTRSEAEGPSVLGLLEKHPLAQSLNPVGRLDKDSSGLLLLTNDGRLQYAIVDPASHVEKEYHVTCNVPPLPSQLKRLQEGMSVEGHRLRSCVVEKLDALSFRIILTEGRNRQIRKMVKKVGLEVRSLKRLRVGPLALGSLAPGSWRELSSKEIKALEAATEIL